MTEISKEYAELSLRAGLFAGVADNFLGGNEFITRLRAQAWDFTSEKLAAWKQEVIARGVPAHALELTPSEVAQLPEMIATGMKMQQAVDEGRAVIMMKANLDV